MARQQGFVVQNKPIKGLITEQTALSFGDDACTEIWDCALDDKGRVRRRKGWRLETGAVASFIETQTGGQANTEYVWDAPGGDVDARILAQQIGYIVYFYHMDNDRPSSNNPFASLDLRNYLAPWTELTDNPGLFRCQYTDGNNDLFIVNPITNPIGISYDSTGSLSFTEIEVEMRDFEGLEDGLGDTERPVSSVAAIKVSNPNYFYNIINNGWGQTDALTQWDAARTDLPSKADRPGFYRASQTDAFDPAMVTANSPGSSLGKGGHFILQVNDPNRGLALSDDGHTGVIPIDPLDNPVPSDSGVTLGNGNNPSNAFDGSASTYTAQDPTPHESLAVGKNYGVSPIRVLKAKISPRHRGSEHFFADSISFPTQNVVIELRASNAPPNPDDYDTGTLLGSFSYTENNTVIPYSNFPDGVEIVSNNQTTLFQYVWVLVRNAANTAGRFWISEVVFYDNDARVLARREFNSVAFFTNRLWYSSGNKLYFTQIIESKDQYGRAYQTNDPTSEELSDLLPSDGGVISIPDMGKAVKLFPAQNAMIVFASNGVWQIGGAAGQPFRADDYSVERLSTQGMDAAQSVIDIRGIPAWWGYEGIMVLRYDAQYGKFSVQSLTEETIDSFVQAVPVANRRYIKGAFDMRNRVAYWLYSDGVYSDLDPEFNRILCYNTNTNAFYPWTIPDSDNKIAGIISITNPTFNDTVVVKYLNREINPLAPTQIRHRYAEPSDPANLDWGTIPYESYFITGYKIDGDAQRDVQLGYVTTFLEEETGSGVHIQGCYDFSTNGNSGRWSNRQQAYDAAPNKGSVRMRRLKMRGRGKAIQLRFSSDGNKPFTLIGWGIWETANGTL